MNEQLNSELTKIDAGIRQAVLDADEFLYSKLNRARDENLSRQFFQTTKAMKADIENLESERSFGLSVLADLNDELTQAANVVLEARGRLFDSEMSYQAIQAKQFYLETQTGQQRKDILALKRKLDAHIDSKLNSGDSPTMETITNESTY
jgi:predicted  nucleic acid-binding Zn-ribbon protein